MLGLEDIVDKSGLRAHYKEQTKTLNEIEKKRQSQTLMEKLTSFLADQQGAWVLFYPLSDEPSLLELMKTCSHLQWLFPLIQDQQSLQFYKPQDLSSMISGDFGVLEPDPKRSELFEKTAIQGFLVPGLAFDRYGVRLGRGKGHYDRALENTNALKVGVTFDSGLTSSLPKENHDQLMNIVVSPSEWVDVADVRKEVCNGN